MSFIQPHSAAPSPYSVYKEGFQQKEEYIFYTYASAHFQRFMLRRPPSHSDLGLKCFDKGVALTWEGDKLLGATPCTRIHGQTHTETLHMEMKTICFRNPTPNLGAGLQRLGMCVVEDPVLPGSLRTHRVSQWMSTAAKRSIPEKGPVWGVTALLFSSCTSGSLLPARLKWKAPENRRQGCRS